MSKDYQQHIHCGGLQGLEWSPQELRLFPRSCTRTFLGHLKTYLFATLEFGLLLCSYLETAL